MTEDIQPAVDYATFVAAYRNTSEWNDAVFERMTANTWSTPYLAEHRKHIEENSLGYGDPAFHSLWQILLCEAYRRFGSVRALEIGVFKGQVISLWALIARHHAISVAISAITPLAGAPPPSPGWLTSLRSRLDARFRAQLEVGNFYPDEDYPRVVETLFRRFNLDSGGIEILRGYSTDPMIMDRLSARQFEILYVDGDHTYDGAAHDFDTYGPKVVPGGWLVADDASFDLPGTKFWKGYEAVTRACRRLEAFGFRNVLNVGHNRVYERLAAPPNK